MDKESSIISKENGPLDVDRTDRPSGHLNKRPVWNEEVERRIREKLTEEYAQANGLISFASRAANPIDNGLIKEAESAESMIKFIKKELGVWE